MPPPRYLPADHSISQRAEFGRGRIDGLNSAEVLGLGLSGVLANWMVGMAAFMATMGRAIVGKYIPVVLAVTLFVAAGF